MRTSTLVSEHRDCRDRELGSASRVAGTQSESEAGASVLGPGTGTGVTASTLNPLPIALLHWYDANLAATFEAGPGPVGMAFDRADVWVAMDGNSSVARLRTSDGKAVATFKVGTNPRGVAFDGANVWVTTYGSNNVTKLRASDGAILGTVGVGNNPELLPAMGPTYMGS